MAHPEHNLQVKINQWVRECVPMPHFFCGIDRSKATGAHTHAREAARGLIAGTPDTVLLIPHLPGIMIELKTPGNTPTDRQDDVGVAITAAGHLWGWCDSVTGYMALLEGFGVALAPRADVLAARHDAVLAAAANRRSLAPKSRVAVRKKPGHRNEWGSRVVARAAKAGIRL